MASNFAIQYIRNTPNSLGHSDVMIVKDPESLYPNLNFNGSVIGKLQNAIPSMIFYPRLYSAMKIYTFGDSPNNAITGLLIGANFTLEHSLQIQFDSDHVSSSIGTLWKVNANYTQTSQPFWNNIPAGEVVLTASLAETLNVSINDLIYLNLITGPTLLRIYEIVENDGRFPNIDLPMVFVDLAWLQYTLGIGNQINMIEGVYSHPETIYSLWDITGTENQFSVINQQITQIMGADIRCITPNLYQYQLAQPEFFLVGLMVFILLIAFIIIWCYYCYIHQKRIKDNQFYTLEKDLHADNSLNENLSSFSTRWVFGELFFCIISLLISIMLSLLLMCFLLDIPVNMSIFIWDCIGELCIFMFFTLYHILVFQRQLNKSESQKPQNIKKINPQDFPSFWSTRRFWGGLCIAIMIFLSFLLFPTLIVQFDSVVLRTFISLIILGGFIGLAVCLIEIYSILFKRITSQIHFHRPLLITILFSLSILFFSVNIMQIQNQPMLNLLTYQTGADFEFQTNLPIASGTMMNLSTYNSLKNSQNVKNCVPILDNLDFRTRIFDRKSVIFAKLIKSKFRLTF